MIILAVPPTTRPTYVSFLLHQFIPSCTHTHTHNNNNNKQQQQQQQQQVINRKWKTVYLIAATVIILSDLEGLSLIASLFKCNFSCLWRVSQLLFFCFLFIYIILQNSDKCLWNCPSHFKMSPHYPVKLKSRFQWKIHIRICNWTSSCNIRLGLFFSPTRICLLWLPCMSENDATVSNSAVLLQFHLNYLISFLCDAVGWAAGRKGIRPVKN